MHGRIVETATEQLVHSVLEFLKQRYCDKVVVEEERMRSK